MLYVTLVAIYTVHVFGRVRAKERNRQTVDTMVSVQVLFTQRTIVLFTQGTVVLVRVLFTQGTIVLVRVLTSLNHARLTSV